MSESDLLLESSHTKPKLKNLSGHCVEDDISPKVRVKVMKPLKHLKHSFTI